MTAMNLAADTHQLISTSPAGPQEGPGAPVPTPGGWRLWAHQEQAGAAAEAELAHADRALLVLACGSGKTIVGAEVSRRIASDAPVLVVVPTLELLAQTASAYAAYLGPGAGRIGAVCSEAGSTATAADMDRELAAAHLGVSTDPGEVARWLAATGRTTVLCTYQSLGAVLAAHRDHGARRWGLIIIDEAHRSAGRVDRAWHIVHRAIPADKRLYMTATPRIMDTAELNAASMDDPGVFGREVYRLPFGQAIETGLLADYRVIVSVVNEHEVHRLLYRDGALMDVEGAAIPATMLAAQIALLKAAREYGLRRVITYHRRVLSAGQFAKTLATAAKLLEPDERPERLSAHMVSGEQPLELRRAILAHLAGDQDATVVVANARVLGEGVDVPALDAVMFTDPRESPTDIVQAVGRALRRGGTGEKIATIIIPLMVTRDEADAAALDGSVYDTVWRTIRALRAHDERLADWLDAGRVRLTAEELHEGAGREAPLPAWLTVAGENLPAGFAQAIATRIVNAASSSWWATYARLAAFKDRTGRINPTLREDPSLHHFVTNNRFLGKNGRLAADRRTALDTIGFVWDEEEKRLEQLLAHAAAYKAEHGHLMVPQTYTTPSGYRLGSRMNSARTRADGIPERVRQQLDEMGMVWSVPDAEFALLLTHARSWFDEHGTLDVGKQQRCCGDYPLAGALKRKRRLHARGALPEAHFQALEEFGMRWGSRQDRATEAGLAGCRRWLQQRRAEGVERPILDVPVHHVDSEGYGIGDFISALRAINNGTRAGFIPDDLRRELDGMGMIWRAAADGRPATEQELDQLRAMETGRARSPEHRALTDAIVALVDRGVWASSIADALGIKRSTLSLRIKAARER